MLDNLVTLSIVLGALICLFGVRGTFTVLVVGGLAYAVFAWGSPKVWIGGFFVFAGVVGVGMMGPAMEATSKVLTHKKRAPAHRPTYAELRGTTRAEHEADLRAKQEADEAAVLLNKGQY